MSDEQPFQPLGRTPEAPSDSEEVPPKVPAPRRRDRGQNGPFWSYSDLALFVGLLIGSAAISIAVVGVLVQIFHVRMPNRVTEALIVQSLLYLLSFSALALLLRIQYGAPFWRSLGWTRLHAPALVMVVSGILTALGVAFLGVLLRTPTTSNRITEMLADPRSVAFVALFGLTLGPLAEELIFRGFLQPLLVRSLGAVAGVFTAAIPFGLLHFQEYGNSWRHALLITLAGAAFGWMRHRTGSTKASTLMHASYNALEFAAYFAQQKESA